MKEAGGGVGLRSLLLPCAEGLLDLDLERDRDLSLRPGLRLEPTELRVLARRLGLRDSLPFSFSFSFSFDLLRLQHTVRHSTQNQPNRSNN